ncbi:Uncharacterised protein [Achromobacter xylosoxidans]|nr:Uncharacterised protein [Achromobacter xylosoxidans]
MYDTAQLPVVVARVDGDAPRPSQPQTQTQTQTQTQAPAANAGAAGMPAAPRASMPANADAAPSNAAAIIDDHPLAQLTRPSEADVPNPLAALAVTAAPPKPASATPRAATAKAPGPAAAPRGERARDGALIAAATPAATSKTAPARGKAAPRNDSDAALLATLMSYGLPPASPPGTKVYKTDGIFIRELPGSPLSARLAECRKLGFLESEQCRLRVCAGHWGTAPECPNAQAHIEP